MKGQIASIEKLATKLMKENKDWRYGQSIFNATYDLYPNVADQLRGTSLDCFYQDQKVGVFLMEVEYILKHVSSNTDHKI